MRLLRLLVPGLFGALLISCGGGSGGSAPTGTTGVAQGLIAMTCQYTVAKSAICIYNADGSGPIERIEYAGLTVDFAWSPDGRQIAISTGEELYVAKIGGGSQLIRETTLVEGLFQASAWSPDGKRLAVSTGDLWILDVNGSTSQQYPAHISGGTGPTWSPDGIRLAFNCDQVLCTIDADGNNLRRLAGTTMHPFASPIWAPDGERILFANGNLDISWVRPDGSAGGNLMPAGVLSADELALSQDGRRIAFKGDALHIYVMNSDGADLKRVSSGELVGACRSPDTRISHHPCLRTESMWSSTAMTWT